jgi:hypothetical protein
MVFFVFNGLKWEVVVYFVDIGEIVDHHWLNFLFILIWHEVPTMVEIAIFSISLMA